MKKSIGNLLLTLCSTLFILVVVEVALRFILFNSDKGFEVIKNPKLYSKKVAFSNEPFYNEDFWILRGRFSAGNL